MNFGDVLNQWEKNHPVFDKDAQAKSLKERSDMRKPEYVKSLKIDATVDLHGLTQDEAWEKLNEFVGGAFSSGARKILIVHGKGTHSSDGGVLSDLVRRFIKGDPRLGQFGTPDDALGGSGATWVVVRR